MDANSWIDRVFEAMSLGGQIHPYVGLALGVLVVIIAIVYGINAGKKKWEKAKKKAGEMVGGEAPKKQKARDTAHQNLDDFLDD